MPYTGGYRRGGGRSSQRGGGRYNSGGSGGRGSSGRGGGGRGGGSSHMNEFNLGHPTVKLCSHFMKGSCRNGDNCTHGHVIQVISQVQNSNKDTSSTSNNTTTTTTTGSNGRYNNNNYQQNRDQFFPTTDIALWMEKTDSPLKIFTSSHDGHWRLYNTANGQFQKEVEHNMNGKVHTILVMHNFLFCGFEAVSTKIPGQTVGMIFAWNLSNPGDAPMELHMGTSQLAPYAHSKGVTTLITHDDVCFSGGKDHIIRIWKFDATMNQAKGGFKLLKECCGHVGEVTGLVFLNGMLWSSSTDGTIRLWDSNSNWECKHLIAGANPSATQGAGGQLSAETQGVGHTNAVTSLIPFQSEQGGATFILSSSMDGDIKVWDSANGNCLSTTSHGDGVVTMALSKDLKGHPILLCGLMTGAIVIRGLIQTAKTAPMAFLCSVKLHWEGVGHDGAIYRIIAGPPNTNYANTFYTAGDDGKMIIWQLIGDLKMS